GTRIKVFESTGRATNGRLYAGDLNAVQDALADQVNFNQEIDVAALGIGEAALKLLRYGAGEARISGLLRTDGILRGLGGLYAGAFTTTQRDAIAAGFRPYGLIILNTTTNQVEWNKGTDAAPSWSAMSPAETEVAVGSVSDWPWAAETIPSWSILHDGQAISRTTCSALSNLAAQSGYAYGNGDGSTTFGVPDFRGRSAIGKDDMGGAASGRLTVAISGVSGTSLGAVGGAEGITLSTGQIPAHNHGISDPTHAHTVYDPTHAHGIGDPGHAHGVADPGHTHGYPYDDGQDHNWQFTIKEEWHSASAGPKLIYSALTGIGIYGAGTGVYVGGSGTGIGIYGSGTGITVNNTGGNAVHSNVPPVVVVNKIMRAV